MPPIVNQERVQDFVELLTPFEELFSESFPGVAPSLPQFKIELKPDAVLPRLAPRRLSPQLEVVAREEISELEALGIVRKSTSAVASPIVLVLYPNGKRRLCVDYRLLNLATIPMMYPIRNVKALISRVGGKSFFAKLDLYKGYHQIQVHPDTIPLLAFCVPWGLFEYVRMPFGPRNGPSFFQLMMDNILSDLLYVICETFIDDILIYGDSIDELLVNCKKVMDRLLAAGLRCRASKSEFGSSSIQYLGYVISEKGIKMSEERVKMISSIQPPENRKELRSFNGMINYFHDFIPNFAVVASSLFAMGSSSAPFEWNEQLQSAFNQVKLQLNKCQLLHFIDYNYPIVLRTDASIVGIGGVLLQVVDDVEQYIVFISKAFNAVQKRWSTIEQEAYGVYFCILAVSNFVLGHHFIVETDHKNLLYLEKASAPKLIRWRLRLQEFDFTLRHVAGKDHVIADVMSRVHHAEGSSSSINMVSDELVKLLDTGQFVDVVAQFHNSSVGHRGVNLTLKMMADVGISFPNCRKIVYDFIGNCAACQKLAPIGAETAGPSRPVSSSEPFQCIALDTIGPLPPDDVGHKFIIVCVDSFTRFVDLFPAVDTTASSAVEALVAVFGRYGLPQEILTDNGSQYSNHLLSQLLSVLKVDHKFTVPYRSQGNGIVERVNKEVMRHLRAIIFDERVESKWSTLLPRVQYLINSTTHSAIGTSPLHLLFGGNISNTRGFSFSGFNESIETSIHASIVNLYKNEEDIRLAALRHQESVESARIAKTNNQEHIQFVTGDLVLVAPPSRPASKLAVIWKGPAVVLECRSRSYRIRSVEPNAKSNWVDVSRLKLYSVGVNTLPKEQVILRDLQEYEVEAILGHEPIVKGYKGNLKSKFYYRVKWTGFPDEENTDATHASLKDVGVFKQYCQVNNLK